MSEKSIEEVSGRYGDWIQTASHRKFWPIDPRPEEIFIEDIAHSLSNLCRFTGHTREFYSVAQHSVLASKIVPKEYALAALLHDAAEAYMGDIARPWKRFLHVMWQRELSPGVREKYSEPIRYAEHRLLEMILVKFGANPVTSESDEWSVIDDADTKLLVTEARDLMAPLADTWRHSEANGYSAMPEVIDPWPPIGARNAFLLRFRELTDY